MKRLSKRTFFILSKVICHLSISLILNTCLEKDIIKVKTHLFMEFSPMETWLKMDYAIHYGIQRIYLRYINVYTFSKHGKNVRTAPGPRVTTLVKDRVKFDWIFLPS